MSFISRIKGAFEQLVGTSDDKVNLLFQSGAKGVNISYLTAYEKSIYINKALEKRATKVGEIEFTAKKGDTEIVNAPILELLAKPNPLMTQSQFFSMWQKYKDIFGEVYVWKKKGAELFAKSKVSELHLLMPMGVKKYYNTDGTISYYTYTTEGGSEQRYEIDEIIYDRRPNPRDIRQGISLLKAGILTISSSLEIEKLQYEILKNGGKLDTVISFKERDKLTKLQTEELREKYTEKYAEAKRTGAPMFLGGDVQVNNLGLNPAELGYLEGKKMTLDDLCILTEVPKPLLALAEGSTFDNADLALRSFLKETILPEQKSIGTLLNSDVDLASDFKLDIVDKTPENIDAKIKLAENGFGKYLSVNEIREIFGRDPIEGEGGDDVLVPFNMTTLSSVTAEPVAEATPAPTPADPNAKGAFAHPLQNKEFRAKYYNQFLKKADKNELTFKRAFNSYALSQRERVIEKVNKYVRAYNKANVEDLFDVDMEISIGVKRLMPVMMEIARKSGQDAINLVGGKRDFNLNANLHSWLDNKAKIFLKQVNETTFNQLKTQFAESVSSGETFSDLATRIKGTYKDITTGRAFTIARTETNGIMGKSTLDGYDQVGMRIKIWVHSASDSPREEHEAMDGEEQPLNSPFTNGLMFPGDPAGSPEDVINCHCTI